MRRRGEGGRGVMAKSISGNWIMSLFVLIICFAFWLVPYISSVDCISVAGSIGKVVRW